MADRGEKRSALYTALYIWHVHLYFKLIKFIHILQYGGKPYLSLLILVILLIEAGMLLMFIFGHALMSKLLSQNNAQGSYWKWLVATLGMEPRL